VWQTGRDADVHHDPVAKIGRVLATYAPKAGRIKSGLLRP
jgi:hypothetical protein